MDQASRYKKYNQTKVSTANPGTLLIMLYDGAIKFLKFSVIAINEKDNERANNNIIRAEAIIIELMTSLKMDIGGEIAKNLYLVYDFMYHELVEANMKKDKEKIERIISMLQTMKETWQEVIRKEAATSSNEKKEDISKKLKGVNIAV